MPLKPLAAHPQPSLEPSRLPTAAEGLALLVGAVVSFFVVRAALATAVLNVRLDSDVGAMVIVLLAPSGIAWLGTACLAFWPSPRRWSPGTWLWPAVAATSAAWSAVFLDGGMRLGETGRMISGVTAMVVSPCVAVAATVIGAVSLFRRQARYNWSHWLGVALGLVTGAGWIWFLGIMLPLRF
jgi:hypothetical protein